MDPRSVIGLFCALVIIDFASPALAALGENCASDEGPMCAANLQNLQVKDGGDVTKLSVPDLVQRCSDLRKNIACLLRHTQSCVSLEKRDQHAKMILEARKYLTAICEADESVKAHWKDNKCYRQATLQRCDREFQELMQHKASSYPPTDNQCRNFYQYQSCVQRTVALCSDDSEEFVALYLLDYGARLAWLCPPNGDDQGHHQAKVLPGNLPLDPLMPQGPGGTQQGSSNGKISLSDLTEEARSRLDDTTRSFHDSSHVDLSNPSQPSKLQVANAVDEDGADDADDVAHEIVVSLKPIVNPRSARDVASRQETDELDSEIPDFPTDSGAESTESDSEQAALSGSSGSTCVKLIQSDMRRCYNRYQRQESELKKQQSRNKSTTVASDAQQIEAKPKICCAFGAYTHCLQTAVQTRCSQDREALVDTVISQTSKLIGGHCEEYYYGSPKCSSGVVSLLPSTCLVLLLAISLRYLAVQCALL